MKARLAAWLLVGLAGIAVVVWLAIPPPMPEPMLEPMPVSGSSSEGAQEPATSGWAESDADAAGETPREPGLIGDTGTSERPTLPTTQPPPERSHADSPEPTIEAPSSEQMAQLYHLLMEALLSSLEAPAVQWAERLQPVLVQLAPLDNDFLTSADMQSFLTYAAAAVISEVRWRLFILAVADLWYLEQHGRPARTAEDLSEVTGWRLVEDPYAGGSFVFGTDQSQRPVIQSSAYNIAPSEELPPDASQQAINEAVVRQREGEVSRLRLVDVR